MKRQGFTIIEMLAVIVVLALISIVSLPKIVKTIASSKDSLYKEQISRIEKLAYEWGIKNIDSLPTKNKDARFISINGLFKNKVISEKEIINPKNGKNMDGCIKVTVKNKRYKFNYVDKKCSVISKSYGPKFNKVKQNVTVELGSNYVFPKVKAKDILGKTVEVTGPYLNGKKIDYLTTKGANKVYTLVYKAHDKIRNITSELKIKVKIIDTKDPIIIVNNKSESFTMIKPTYADEFKIPKAHIIDNSDEKVKLTVTSNVSSIPGIYSIRYVAKDSSNNIGVLIVKVKVIDTKKPTIINVSGNSIDWTNKDITLKVDNNYSNSDIVQYSFDDGKTWQKENYKTFDVNQVVYIKIKDSDGNVSDTYQEIISKIDKNVPDKIDVKLKLNSIYGSQYKGNWVNKNVYLIADANDSLSGINHYEISTDKTNFVKFDNYYVLNKNGNQDYYLKAIDNASNVSEIFGPYKVMIDKESPSVVQSSIKTVKDNKDYKGNWTTDDIIWSDFKVNDNGSDIDHYEISQSCNDKDITNLDGSYIFNSNTNKKYCIRAIDQAGNIGKFSKPYSFKIDRVGPSNPVVSLFMNNINGGALTEGVKTNENIYAKFKSVDSGSGISKYQYSFDNNNYIDVNLDYHVFDKTISGLIYVRGIDKVGNIGNPTIFTIAR